MARINLHLVDGRTVEIPEPTSRTAADARRWLAAQVGWVHAEYPDGIVAVRVDAIVSADITA
jgi:hypothetical protein